MTLGIPPTSNPRHELRLRSSSKGSEGASYDIPSKVRTNSEKPDKAMAEVLCLNKVYWEFGNIHWKVSSIQEEMEKYIPDVTAVFSG